LYDDKVNFNNLSVSQRDVVYTAVRRHSNLDSGNASLGLAENTDELFVRKMLLYGDVLMLLMKTLLTSWC